MKKKTSKSPKLRSFVCVICNSPFQNYFAPSEVKAGKGKVCSLQCRGKLSSIQNKTGKYKQCVKCNKDFYCRPSENRRSYKHLHCSRKCFGNLKKKRKMSIDGYWVIHVPPERGAYKDEMKEHRWIMEQHLKRKLLSIELVHHINHDKLDNRIENLQLMTRAEHNTHHFSKSIST